MDEHFLSKFREAPRPEFSEVLWGKLHQQTAAESAPGRRWASWRAPALAVVSVLVVLAGLLSFPSLRAAAQHFLDLFRVQRFVAVSIEKIAGDNFSFVSCHRGQRGPSTRSGIASGIDCRVRDAL